MASNIRTFTITQARMGEPLQFQPALGSKELEDLVDAYVPGSATKQDKLSEVTLEFFNLAQVDIYTGLLTRHYTVAVSPNWTHLAFEQSPTQSQSSSFSPPIFTPSPASSMTFADSGYGSISMTPPTRAHGAPNRVTKKPKKDTKKTAEVRLPGFSIMTKDGVDVTSSAGRGTKTKEQREHAHLMRIMKACDDCKRKKVRCDPSHRRPQTDMSRSSTSTASSSAPKPSPPVSIPSLSRATTHPSPPELPSFGANTIDDFVLFPEDNVSSWNSADMSFPEYDENLDLSQFNFDISGLNDFPPMINTVDQSFDFSFNEPPAAGFDHSSDHNPFVNDQYGLDNWASAQGGDLSVSHTRPHHSISSQDSGQLDSSFFDSGIQSTEPPGLLTTPSSQGTSSFADNFWPASSVTPPQIAQSSSVSLPSAEVDWSILDSGVLPSPEGELSLPMNRRERRNISRMERARNTVIQQLVDSIPSAHGSEARPVPDSLDSQQSTPRSSSDSLVDSLFDQPQSPGAATGGSLEYWGIENTRALVAEATQALKSAPTAYQPIYEELRRLRGFLDVVKSGDTEGPPVLQQAMASQLEMLTSQLEVLLTRVKNVLRASRVSTRRYNRLDPEFHPNFLNQSSVQTRRLVSALCARINSLQKQDTGTGGVIAATNSPILSSGNVQVTLSPNSSTQSHPQDAAEYIPNVSYSSLSSGSLDFQGNMNQGHIRLPDSKTITLDDGHEYYAGDGFSAATPADGSGIVGIATIKAPRYHLVTKPAFERLSRLVEEQSEQNEVEIDSFSQLDSVSPLTRPEFVSVAMPTNVPTVGLSRSNSESPQNEIVNLWSLFRRVPLDCRPTQLFQLDPAANPAQDAATRSVAIAQPTLQTDAAILTERDQEPRLLPAGTNSYVSTSQTVGSSRSESLSEESELSSPGSIPGTVLSYAAYYNVSARPSSLVDTLGSYITMLASLVLLNYLQAAPLILPLAALFLAIPNPSPAKVAIATLASVIALSLPVSSLMSGSKYLVTASFMLAPLFKRYSAGSFGGALSSSKRSLSTFFTQNKDTSLLGMFNELSLGRSLSAV